MISYNQSKTIFKKSLIKLGEEFIKTNKCLNRVTSKIFMLIPIILQEIMLLLMVMQLNLATHIN